MAAETSTSEGRVTPSAAPEVFLKKYRRIKECHDVVEEAQAGETAAVADAAAASVHIAAMKMADKIVKMGPREGKTCLDKVFEYVNLISGGMMTQGEMFPDEMPVVSEDVFNVQRNWAADRDAEKIGYAAGKNAEPASNNQHQQGTSLFERWDAGWRKGHEEYVRTRGATDIHPGEDLTRSEDDPEDGVS